MRIREYIGTVGLVMLLLGSKAAEAQEPKFGLGISNQLQLMTAQIPGAKGPAVPFSTLSAKGFFGDRFAGEFNLGVSLAAPEVGDATSLFLIGGKFHIIAHRFSHSHFFVNAGFHLLNATVPDAFAFNFGVNAGWEYVLPAGLPGLGISPEFGLNYTYLNPDGPGNNVNVIQFNGYGSEFPFVLMNIRYYFM